MFSKLEEISEKCKFSEMYKELDDGAVSQIFSFSKWNILSTTSKNILEIIIFWHLLDGNFNKLLNNGKNTSFKSSKFKVEKIKVECFVHSNFTLIYEFYNWEWFSRKYTKKNLFLESGERKSPFHFHVLNCSDNKPVLQWMWKH